MSTVPCSAFTEEQDWRSTTASMANTIWGIIEYGYQERGDEDECL